MKKDKYHIDVTPEEDSLFREIVNEEPMKVQSNPLANSKVIVLVVAFHLIGAAALMAFTPGGFLTKDEKKAAVNATNPSDINELKKEQEAKEEVVKPPPHANDVPMDQAPRQDQVPIAKPTPSPSPKPSPAPKEVHHKQEGLMKEYVVKKGDTIYSIAKRFKLRIDRLLKINQIKDPSKIKEGQKLKFL